MPPSRIVIVGDLLRPDTADPLRSEAVTRTRWLADLLSPALLEATGLAPQCLTAESGDLHFAAMYRACGLEPSNDTWARLYAGDLGAALTDRLVTVCRDAIVIGIELPPSILRVLAHAGVPALDCIVHPWRFMDDIPLGWRSAVPEVAAALARFAVSDFDVRRHVGMIRAKARWLRRLQPAPLEPGTTLVLEQLPGDAAMIDPTRHRTVSWDDYRDVVQRLLHDGPVAWRPHPYAGEHGTIAALLGPRRMTRTNFYCLLADDHLESVVAISSGGVVEARAFGKPGRHLLDRDAGIAGAGWSEPVPVIGHWLSPHFWSTVLAPLISTNPDVPVLPPEPDTFRRANNTDWDFGWIRTITQDRAEERLAHRLDEAERQLAENERRFLAIVAHLQLQDDRVTSEVRRLDEADRDLREEIDEGRVGGARLRARVAVRVRAVIDEVVREAEAGRWRVGIFGAGSHTEWLLRDTRLAEVADITIVDSNEALAGRRLDRFVVQSASLLPSLDLDAIVVSSLVYEDEMVAQLQALALPGVRIVRCHR